MNEALCTFVNSVKKPCKMEMKRLSKRIESTIRWLEEYLFKQLKQCGYFKASVLAKSHSRLMVIVSAKTALTRGKGCHSLHIGCRREADG
jgi:hypothetical protein